MSRRKRRTPRVTTCAKCKRDLPPSAVAARAKMHGKSLAWCGSCHNEWLAVQGLFRYAREESATR